MSATCEWPPSAGVLGLDTDEVHVIRVSLDVASDVLTGLGTTLAADERARAERVRDPRLRARAVAARGLLRAVLARYAGTDARDVRFAAGPHGKPYLAADGQALRFNLAHSEAVALIALARAREVGVDIERERDDLVDLDVARRVLGRAAADRLAGLPPGARTHAFFALWTRHEATVKASGRGLEDVDADLASGRATCSVCELAIEPGYAAAVAVEGAPGAIHCWDWSAARTSTP